jgi:hypothetical protein
MYKHKSGSRGRRSIRIIRITPARIDPNTITHISKQATSPSDIAILYILAAAGVSAKTHTAPAASQEFVKRRLVIHNPTIVNRLNKTAKYRPTVNPGPNINCMVPGIKKAKGIW